MGIACGVHVHFVHVLHVDVDMYGDIHKHNTIVHIQL